MEGEPSGSARTTIETALRYLGTRDHGVLVDLLEHAIDRPHSTSGRALASLTEPTAVLEGWTPTERAHALWRVIREGVQDPDVSPTPLSRRRHALQAAFRLPNADIHEPWGSSLTERFKQLKTLKAVFGGPTSTQPMEMAWKRGVRGLATYLDQRFRGLQVSADWERYRPKERQGRDFQGAHPDEWVYPDASDDADTVFRQPSKGAQPVFVNLFITTVFMKKRAVYRRITERLITARADGVEYYTARGFAVAKAPKRTYVPVQALWGCRAEFVKSSRAKQPAVTRLWFTAPLQKGQQAHFASEAVFDLDEGSTDDRDWIDVDIDHHGIARGRLLYGGRLPIGGLTIRIRFDETCLPDAVWWYAEQNVEERYDRPPPGDPRLLTITNHDVQHTFTDRVCQPRESYGLAISWPPADN